MNVYDFDKTLYEGDSTLDFYWFCLVRQPSLLGCLPRQLWRMGKSVVLRQGLTARKEGFYSFLSSVDHPLRRVEEFWAEGRTRLRASLALDLKEGDVVISASPRFLLAPICRDLRVRLIASEVDPATGRCLGANCKGEEKVSLFRKQFPDALIEKFYSDSRSDAPMASLARQAFLVKGDDVQAW